MNINLLTIDSTLAATTGISSVPSKPDASRKVAKFSLTPDDKHPQVNSIEKPTADNINEEIRILKEPISKSPQEFTQSIRKRPKSENRFDVENKTKSKEQNAASGTIKHPKKQHNLIKRWLAEHLVAVQQGKEGATTKKELQNLIKSRLAEHPIAVEQSKEGTGTKKELQNLIKSRLTEHLIAVGQSKEGAGTKKELQNLIKSRLAEHPIAVEQSKEGAGTKIEPKAGRQLAQIIANTRTGKSPPVTGHAVKSAEIKLLHSTEKGQLGLKTVLPAKSEGQNGLKTGTPGKSKNPPIDMIRIGTGNSTDKLTVSAKAIAETKSVAENVNAKELASEFPANTGKSTTTNSGKTPAVTNNLPAIQAKAWEMQPQPVSIDPEKSVPTEEAEAKTTASETLSKLLNLNGKETTHPGNNLSENQSVQKLNIAAVQVSNGQTKDQGNSTSNKNTSQGFEQIFSHNTPQTLITEQIPAAAKNATTDNMPGQTSSSNVSADIGKQILESIHSSASHQGAERQITVRLNPPELGKVFIRFRQQDAELTGVMEVSKAQTRFEIEQTLPQIIRNLADSGIQIKRFEVILSNEEQSGQGTLGNQSLQSGGTQQQNSANHGMPGYNPDADESNEWLASNNSYENLYEFQEGFIADGSINMLI
jgi:flagellar hook-length control protein FliK